MNDRKLSPDEARAKLAVRKAVALIGGVDGAAATVARGRSTVGRWICLNDSDMPPLDCAMAIDAALVAMGHAPLVLTAALSAVGFVPFALPGNLANCSTLHHQLSRLVKENGDIASVMMEALADGKVDPAEAAAAIEQVDEALGVQVALRATLVAISEGEGELC